MNSRTYWETEEKKNKYVPYERMFKHLCASVGVLAILSITLCVCVGRLASGHLTLPPTGGGRDGGEAEHEYILFLYLLTLVLIITSPKPN